MKLPLLLFAVLYPFLIMSQEPPYGNLTIFSEKGDKFFLYLNGEKKNETARAKVRVEKLTQLSYSVKIVYDEASHFTISKNNVFIADGDDNLMDAIYRIARSGSQARLRFYAMNPIKDNHKETLLPGIDYTKTDVYFPSTGALTVFSEQGDSFFLYLNGEKQNETAQSNIRVENLDQLSYTVKIIFKDTKLNSITKTNVFVSDGDDVMMDATYKLSRTSWYPKLKFYGMNPVKSDYKAPAGLYVHRYGNKVQKTGDGKISEPVKMPSQLPVVTIQQPSTDTVKQTKPELVKEAAGKNVQLTKENKQASEKVAVNNAATSKKTIPAEKKEMVNTVKKNGATNAGLMIREPEGWICQNEWPMWKADFAMAKKKITEEKSETLKLASAKLLVNQSCLSCDEVAEIAGLLIQEDSRLEFVKFAFNHTIDFKNYGKVFRVLTSFKSKENLHQFISE